MRRERLFVLVISCLGVLQPPQALAQAAYPNRPIRCIVPFPPGGGAEATVRAVALPEVR